MTAFFVTSIILIAMFNFALFVILMDVTTVRNLKDYLKFQRGVFWTMNAIFVLILIISIAIQLIP